MSFTQQGYQNFLNYQRMAQEKFGPDWINKDLYSTSDEPFILAEPYQNKNPASTGRWFQSTTRGPETSDPYETKYAFVPWGQEQPSEESTAPWENLYKGGKDNPAYWDRNKYGNLEDYSDPTDHTKFGNLPDGKPVSSYLSELEKVPRVQVSSKPNETDGFFDVLKSAASSPFGQVMSLVVGAGSLFNALNPATLGQGISLSAGDLASSWAGEIGGAAAEAGGVASAAAGGSSTLAGVLEAEDLALGAIKNAGAFDPMDFLNSATEAADAAIADFVNPTTTAALTPDTITDVGGVASDATGSEVVTSGGANASPQLTETAPGGSDAVKFLQDGTTISQGDLANSWAGEIGKGGTAETTFKPPSKGIVGSVMDWAKNNQQLASTLLQTAGGAIGGIGKAESDKALLERKAQLELQNKEASMQFSRDFSTGSAYQGGAGFRPSGAKELRRPDGTLVYTSGGLINRARN